MNGESESSRLSKTPKDSFNGGSNLSQKLNKTPISNGSNLMNDNGRGVQYR